MFEGTQAAVEGAEARVALLRSAVRSRSRRVGCFCPGERRCLQGNLERQWQPDEPGLGMSAYPLGKMVGVVGGGQLGRMMVREWIAACVPSSDSAGLTCEASVAVRAAGGSRTQAGV